MGRPALPLLADAIAPSIACILFYICSQAAEQESTLLEPGTVKILVVLWLDFLFCNVPVFCFFDRLEIS